MSTNAKALEAEVHKLRAQLKQRRARMKTEVARAYVDCEDAVQRAISKGNLKDYYGACNLIEEIRARAKAAA